MYPKFGRVCRATRDIARTFACRSRPPQNRNCPQQTVTNNNFSLRVTLSKPVLFPFRAKQPFCFDSPIHSNIQFHLIAHYSCWEPNGIICTSVTTEHVTVLGQSVLSHGEPCVNYDFLNFPFLAKENINGIKKKCCICVCGGLH